MLFARTDGGTDVYAHEEASSVHPRHAVDHFQGGSQRVATGVGLARERLPLDTHDAPVDPPDGPWIESQPVGSLPSPPPGHAADRR